jgi:hypothetical protein
VGHVGIHTREISEVLEGLKRDFRDPDYRERLGKLLHRLPPREVGRVQPGDWIAWLDTYGRREVAQVTHSPGSKLMYQKRAVHFVVRIHPMDLNHVGRPTSRYFYDPATEMAGEKAAGSKSHHLVTKIDPPSCCKCGGRGTGLFQDRKDEHYINFYCETCAREIGGIGPDDCMEVLS